MIGGGRVQGSKITRPSPRGETYGSNPACYCACSAEADEVMLVFCRLLRGITVLIPLPYDPLRAKKLDKLGRPCFLVPFRQTLSVARLLRERRTRYGCCFFIDAELPACSVDTISTCGRILEVSEILGRCKQPPHYKIIHKTYVTMH